MHRHGREQPRTRPHADPGRPGRGNKPAWMPNPNQGTGRLTPDWPGRRRRRACGSQAGSNTMARQRGEGKGSVKQGSGATLRKTIAPTRPAVSPRPSRHRTPPLHRITVDEYERIIASGSLEDPSRVELIDGYMVDKMGKSPKHSYPRPGTPSRRWRAGPRPGGWPGKETAGEGGGDNEPEPDVSGHWGLPSPITDIGAPSPATRGDAG